jgi:hypothetical protein
MTRCDRQNTIFMGAECLKHLATTEAAPVRFLATHVEFVLDEAVSRQVFLQLLRFCLDDRGYSSHPIPALLHEFS